LNVTQILSFVVEPNGGLYSDQSYNQADTSLELPTVSDREDGSTTTTTTRPTSSSSTCRLSTPVGGSGSGSGSGSGDMEGLLFKGCSADAEGLADSLTNCGTFRKFVASMREEQ
jgi:hypothetical protein